LHISGTSELEEVEIWDALGRLFVRYEPSGQEADLSTVDLPNGSYVVRALMADGQSSQRLMIAR
jgi:hypothetical protein